MNTLYTFLAHYLEPLTSSFYLLGLLLLFLFISRRVSHTSRIYISLAVFTGIYWLLYRIIEQYPAAARWTERLNSPLVVIIVVLVLPAIFFKHSRWYKYFLILPALLLILSVLEVFHQYKEVPQGFAWFLMRPGYLIAGVISFLVLAHHFMNLVTFRRVTRITMVLVLIYGGFAFRQNYTDYQAMAARRVDTGKNLMVFSETTPVMKYEQRLSYIPSAPCRFSADGGYVQGCVMELLQRILQLDFSKAARGDTVEMTLMAIALAALAAIVVLLFIGARWWCGWICPLSSLGDLFDYLRKKLGLPHIKPSQPMKLTCLVSGLSFAGFTLLLAKAYTHIDSQGLFLGCKLPMHPFCKICPGQQVCPVASKGIGAYPPLPGMEWLFGFFKIAALLLLGLFLFGFITARRLWCRFCPMGMIGGIFNRGGLLALKKDAQKCNGCSVCREVCPMDIHLVQEEMHRNNVSSFDCIYCLKCVDKCPQEKCLSLEFAGKTIVRSKFKYNE